MSERLSVERAIRVYNDDQGYYAQIAPDRDGHDMAELTYSDGDGPGVERSFTLPWPHARKFAEAIIELADKAQENEA